MLQGKIINGFELKHQLGEGGMAEVWYAENSIGKKAAVKVINKGLSYNEQIVERFKNEAKIMVALEHPNIRQAYDFSNIDGQPAIIQEYLEGNDMETLIHEGCKISEDLLVRWWDQLVAALNYTHALGIVHRDIKPSNIFIDKYGNVKLMDFGIAKIVEDVSLTMTGTTLGTRLYMSPEQVRDPKRVGYKSDNYSLAVSYVHLLTGKAPYDTTTSSDFDVQLQIVSKPLDLNNVPENWRNFLLPYLEKDPDKRAELKPYCDNVANAANTKPATPVSSKVCDETAVADNVSQSKLDKKSLADTTKGKYKGHVFVPVCLWLFLVIGIICFFVFGEFTIELLVDYGFGTVLYNGCLPTIYFAIVVVAFIGLLKLKKWGFYLLFYSVLWGIWRLYITIDRFYYVNAVYNAGWTWNTHWGEFIEPICYCILPIIVRLILGVKKNGVSYWKIICKK